jgi:hypothetical protein
VNGLACASNDYEVAEDFEALHIGQGPEEVRDFIAASKSREFGDFDHQLSLTSRRVYVARNQVTRLECPQYQTSSKSALPSRSSHRGTD